MKLARVLQTLLNQCVKFYNEDLVIVFKKESIKSKTLLVKKIIFHFYNMKPEWGKKNML